MPSAVVLRPPRRWRSSLRKVFRSPIAVVAVVGAAAGILERAWLLFHVPIDADQAVVGLMARDILHGHFYAFYWGQSYGGAEPYVVAALSVVLGQSTVAVSVTAAVLAGVAAAITYVCAHRICGDRLVALAAATIVWTWPEEAVWHSTTEFGFRGVTLVCGLVCLACALRIEARGETLVVLFGLGLFAGIGWWSSPEIVYFLVPVALLLLFGKTGRWKKANRRVGLAGPALVAAVGFLIGAAPWIAANIRSRFASLKSSSTGVAAADRTSYLFRVGVFFHHALPQQLGLINPIRQGVIPLTGDGKWVLGGHWGPASYVVALIVIAALIVVGLFVGGVARVMAIGLIAFPFLYAWPLSTAFWEDGRYGPYLPVLMVLTAVAVVAELAPARSGTFRRSDTNRQSLPSVRWAVAVMALVAMALGALGLHQVYGTAGFGPTKIASNWGNPESPVETTVDAMTAQGIRVAWSGYWISNVLDEVGAGRVQVAAVGVVRHQSFQAAALNDPTAAWLFFPSRNDLPAIRAFQARDPGPLSWSLASFSALLSRKGISYSLVAVGVLVAVRPSVAVTPTTLGINPSLVNQNRLPEQSGHH